MTQFPNSRPPQESTPTGLKCYSPGLARQRLPWVNAAGLNPVRVESDVPRGLRANDPTPTGLVSFSGLPRVDAAASTLGYIMATLSGLPNRGYENKEPRRSVKEESATADMNRGHENKYPRGSKSQRSHDVRGLNLKSSGKELTKFCARN